MQTTELLRQKMLSTFPLPISPYCIVDNFPLAVCKFGRARYCKVFRDHGADYGKCPSKKETYFGYKVHALITLEGYITAFEITPVSTDDREGLRDLMDNCSKICVNDTRKIQTNGTAGAIRLTLSLSTNFPGNIKIPVE